jgi:hypothetical protein
MRSSRLLSAAAVAAPLLAAVPARAAVEGAPEPPVRDTAAPVEGARAPHTDLLHGLVYAGVNVGYQKLGLQTLETKSLLPDSVSTSDSGPMISVGAGARILLGTIGVRYRLARFSQWNLSSLGAEAGLHIPAGKLEPHLIVGAGFANLTRKASSEDGGSDLDITGLDLRAGFGVDYYVTKVLSVGAEFDGEALLMPRPGVDYSRSPRDQAADCLRMPTTDQAQQCVVDKAQAADGSSVGGAGSFALGVGVHF